MTHALKTWPEFYELVKKSKKKFEVRKADRPFEIGDMLILQEYNNTKSVYTGQECKFMISYIMYGPAFGIKKGYCVISLEEISQSEY